MSPKQRRRGPGEGSIEKVKLKSGKTAYRGWITVDYKTGEDGKKRARRRSVQRAKYNDVVEGMRRLREKYDKGIDLDAEHMRLGALLDKYLDNFIATVPHKRRTPGTYRWAIGHAKEQLGDPLVAKVTTPQLQDALNRLGPSLAQSSISLVRVVLDGAFTQAVLWRIRPDNPAADLKLPYRRDDSPAPAPRLVLNAEQGRAFLEGLQSERLGLGAALTYALGIRPGEAAALRAQDFDLDKLTVTIAYAHNLVDGKVEREKPKSGRGVRTLPLPPELAPWVRQRIARAAFERQAMRDRWTEADEGLLFVRESDGGRIDNRMLYHAARRVADSLNLGKVGPRVLRRSLLSQLAAQGVDPKVRAAIGGHTTEITEAHYREVDPAEVARAMGRVSSLLPNLAITSSDEEEN